MDMLRYQNKPPRRRLDKPVTKAITVQRRTEALNRRIRIGFAVFYSLAATVLLCTAVAKTPLAAGPSPQVGDVLQITTAATAPGAPLATVPARLLAGPWAHPGQGCWLDEEMMREPGGTLTVLAVRSDGIMLSWVGGDTARIASCPAPGQFMVTAPDYQRLAKISVARRATMMR
jgi:hypothetical protein